MVEYGVYGCISGCLRKNSFANEEIAMLGWSFLLWLLTLVSPPLPLSGPSLSYHLLALLYCSLPLLTVLTLTSPLSLHCPPGNITQVISSQASNSIHSTQDLPVFSSFPFFFHHKGASPQKKWLNIMKRRPALHPQMSSSRFTCIQILFSYIFFKQRITVFAVVCARNAGSVWRRCDFTPISHWSQWY